MNKVKLFVIVFVLQLILIFGLGWYYSFVTNEKEPNSVVETIEINYDEESDEISMSEFKLLVIGFIVFGFFSIGLWIILFIVPVIYAFKSLEEYNKANGKEDKTIVKILKFLGLFFIINRIGLGSGKSSKSGSSKGGGGRSGGGGAGRSF